MSDPVEVTITGLLMGRLNEPAFSPPLEVAWPNVAFTPPAATYLKADILWNKNNNRGVSNTSSTELRGIFQVAVVAAINVGIVTPTGIAAAIVTRFERGAPIMGSGLIVGIEGRPSLATPLPAADRLVIPVSIRFYAFA